MMSLTSDAEKLNAPRHFGDDLLANRPDADEITPIHPPKLRKAKVTRMMTPERAAQILQHDYAHGAFHNGYESESETMTALRIGFNAIRQSVGQVTLSADAALDLSRKKWGEG